MVLKKYRESRLHSVYNADAFEIMNYLSTKVLVDSRDLKKCEEYASDVFGGKEYAPWLKVYTLVHGNFIEGWIPDNYYGQVVVPSLKGQYGFSSRLKPLNCKFFNSTAFPDIASFVNGVFFDRNYHYLSEEKVSDFLFQERDTVVFKVDNSRQGSGVYLINKQDFDLGFVRKLGNGLFQEKINQHSSLAEITPNAVATLRVTTLYQNDGNVINLGSYLRMGRAIDSHVKSNSQIRVAINSEGGFFETGNDANWLQIKQHPDTKIDFAGKIFPEYEASIALVKKLHKQVPFARIVGWDITVDEYGNPIVLEWNGGHNGVNYIQAVHGAVFKGLGFESLKN